MLVFFAFAVLLSIGAINALIPIIIILILIAAAAGSTRGYSIFAILGIGTIAGMGPSGKGSMAGKGSYPFRSILDPNIRGPRKSPEVKAKKAAKKAARKAALNEKPKRPLKPWEKKTLDMARWAVAPAIFGSGMALYQRGSSVARRIAKSSTPQGRRDARSARTEAAKGQLSGSLDSRKSPQYKPNTTPGAPPGSGVVTNRLSSENREIIRRILDSRSRGIGAVPTSAIGVGAGTELRRAVMALKNRQFRVANGHLNNVSKITSHNLQQRRLNAVSGKALLERQKLLNEMKEANEIGRGRTVPPTTVRTTYTGADVGATRTIWGSLAMAGLARLRGDRYASNLYKRDAMAQLKVRSAEGSLALSKRLRYGVTDKKGNVTMGALHQQIGRAARQEKAGEEARAREKRLRDLELFLYGSKDVYGLGGQIGAFEKIYGVNDPSKVDKLRERVKAEQAIADYRYSGDPAALTTIERAKTLKIISNQKYNEALRAGPHSFTKKEYESQTEKNKNAMENVSQLEVGRIAFAQDKLARGEITQDVYENEMGRIQKEQRLLSKLSYEHARLTSGNPPGRIEVSFNRKIVPGGGVEAGGLLPTIKINGRQTGTSGVAQRLFEFHRNVNTINKLKERGDREFQPPTDGIFSVSGRWRNENVTTYPSFEVGSAPAINRRVYRVGEGPVEYQLRRRRVVPVPRWEKVKKNEE